MGGLAAVRAGVRGKKNSLPAQIKENQPTATTGTRILRVMPSRWVKNRSNNGAVMIAEAMPESSKDALIIPVVVSEYPMGS